MYLFKEQVAQEVKGSLHTDQALPALPTSNLVTPVAGHTTRCEAVARTGRLPRQAWVPQTPNPCSSTCDQRIGWRL